MRANRPQPARARVSAPPTRPSEMPAVCCKRHHGGTCGNLRLVRWRQWVKLGEGWLLMTFRKPCSDSLTRRGSSTRGFGVRDLNMAKQRISENCPVM